MGSDSDDSDLPFRQLAQHLPVMCWFSDADGVITWVNDAWLAYTGRGPEGGLGGPAAAAAAG